ncbi:MAG: hypothetical protein A2015_02750 [Spirochaetes bacterium GWF1_31_7]|nr:MAG: hypothetical protein A2Y30_15795 [Spirochaetes bacterium GWE1_32_154]OHD47108.1 MAG: hypothetical protein A2015_02750 [Spirochaetes bacterium GWF1_31_7]OHD51999.1 MAG: hypothetical protein A2Y29_14880 [Spirochaetes bacterium GWE2_31_10]OHD73420.1 MAG: hypothetical protein A2355_05120 [Spirochaetes bacterium RIFOXYB1_FULL_32_8]HBI38286.1 hypothetical protein [Spirochaetia bacterium]
METELIYYKKYNPSPQHIVEIKVWKVPKDTHKPHGYKYSLVLIEDGKRVIGYDNGEQKGDHRHYYLKEEKYNFSTLKKLQNDFLDDVWRYLNA